ncbi:transmembrane protein with metallophosphoesterase domain-like [Lineus longissimus]|uniref:transmembrane protein with metallophosphoesterase domain-like n=1 Tax=Lineus longissimus TaxID=88925 RepID=UPI00315DEB67
MASTTKWFVWASALSLVEIGLLFSQSEVRRIGYASQFYLAVVCFVVYSSSCVVEQVSTEMYDLGYFKTSPKVCWLARLALAVVTMFLAPMCIVVIGVNRHIVGINPSFFTMLFYICFGFTFHLLTITWTMNSLARVIRFIYRCLIQEKGPLIEQTVRSQHNFAQLKALLGFIYAFFISFYGVYYAFQPPIIRKVHIPIENLSKSFDGFRIVQLCDIHLGPTVGKEQLEEVIDAVQKLHPDLIVITGDLVDGHVQDLMDAVEPAKHLQAPYGKFFVSGNHEYLTRDVDNWFRHLRTLGFGILHNDNTKIKKPDSSDEFCLAGVDDHDATKFSYKGHGMDLDKAVSTCDPKYPIILLAHQPNAAKMALESKHDIKLVLSGHTHGGQMFPGSILVYLVNTYYAGLYKVGKSNYVYVSEGAIYWGIPMRILSTKEITEIVLQAS